MDNSCVKFQICRSSGSDFMDPLVPIILFQGQYTCLTRGWSHTNNFWHNVTKMCTKCQNNVWGCPVGHKTTKDTKIDSLSGKKSLFWGLVTL